MQKKGYGVDVQSVSYPFFVNRKYNNGREKNYFDIFCKKTRTSG